MKDIKKYIKVLKTYNDWRRGGVVACPLPQDISIAIDAVIEAAERHTPKWVSVDERLPEEGHHVIAQGLFPSGQGIFRNTLYHSQGNWYDETSRVPHPTKPSHWIALSDISLITS